MSVFDFLRSKTDPPRERIEPTIGNIAEGETVVSSDLAKMGELFDVSHLTNAGAIVTEKTAMRVSAVYSCVTLIAGSIAQLPFKVYKRGEAGSHDQVFDHELVPLLNEQMCGQWSAAAGWEFLAAQMLLRGDGIAYIVRRKSDNKPRALIPYPRRSVYIEITRNSDPRQPARLDYFFSDGEKAFWAPQEDVLHLPGFGFNGMQSMTAIQHGAQAGIGIALRGDEHAGKFFSQGGKPEVAIRAPGRMTPTQQDDFRDAWVAKYGGNGPNSRPLMLTEGLDVKELTMTAVDQQLLESRQWQVIDIARAFRVPPHLIGEMTKGTTWGSGIEQLGIGYVNYTLRPHMNRWRHEINRKLFGSRANFAEYDVESLMVGDLKAQAEYYSKALGGPGQQGWMTVDEVRKKTGNKARGGWADEIVQSGAQNTQNTSTGGQS